MGLTASNKGAQDFPITPEGIHQGICVGIYDLGEQYSEWYKKTSHKCVLVWELPKLRIEITKDGETKDLPRHISKRFTLSLGKRANLTKMLVAWRGKAFTEEEAEAFDLANVLGANCQVQVIHDERGYANIENVIAVGDLKKLKPETAPVFFSFEDVEEGTQMDDSFPFPDGMPKWVKETIQKSETWKRNGEEAIADQEGVVAGELINPKNVTEDEDDDLPF